MSLGEEEKGAFRGVLRSDDFTVVKDEEAVKFLKSKGYGIPEDDVVLLNPVEALYLTYREVLEVFDTEGVKLSFEALLRRFSSKEKDLWLEFIVYSDLRRRGFIVRRAASPLTFFVDKGGESKSKRYLVACLREGVRIGFEELETFFRRSTESDRELVVAIVDKEGNISYYIVEKIIPVRD